MNKGESYEQQERAKAAGGNRRELLEKNIVARTWGNTSCRVDDEHCLITPSGLDYMQTTEEDIVLLDLKNGEWEGRRKPSGERGVHIAAYRQFPGVNFVIHTHQNYATAIGLTGMDSLQITEEEKRQLGGLGAAAYGLPGMKKLTDAVDHVLQHGDPDGPHGASWRAGLRT